MVECCARAASGQVACQQRERALKPAWAAVKYKDKFGEWPPFAWNSLSPANEPSLEVSSWVRSRDIAFAKRMAKERAA